MGIPRFFVWLKHNHPNALQESLPANVSWLIFDMNSLLHQAQQITYGYGDSFTTERATRARQLPAAELEKEYRDVVIALLFDAVTAVNPKEGILLAIDGVAPQAKIQQQRQRRYKAKRIVVTGDEPPEIRELRQPVVDINRITPGTQFMFRLDAFLSDWLEREGNKLGVKRIIYSSHLVPGEGEHKYLELIRSGVIPKDGTHVVYGMDADLLILSLTTPVERLYVFRKDLDKCVSIANFRSDLIRVMRTKTALQDFVLLTFFIGNDFFPHQPALLEMTEAFNALISAYVEVGKSLVEVGELGEDNIHLINWDNLAALTKVMANHESLLLGNEAIKGFSYPSPAFTQAISGEKKGEYIFYPNLFRSLWYLQAFSARGDPFMLELTSQDEDLFQPTDKAIDDMVNYYLLGLAWNLGYYLDGLKHLTRDYYYPYHQVPLFTDLIWEQPPLDDALLKQPDEVQPDPIAQLLSVLPFESQELLPVEVAPLMDWGSPIYDMYPDQFFIDRQATNKEWEGIAILPFVDGRRVSQVVAATPIPSSRRKLFAPQEELEYSFSQEEIMAVHRQREQQAKVSQAVGRTYKPRR